MSFAEGLTTRSNWHGHATFSACGRTCCKSRCRRTWVTGRGAAQAPYLKTLAEEAHDPEAFDPDLEKAEAAKRIDQLKNETGR